MSGAGAGKGLLARCCVVVNPGWVQTDMGGSHATLTPAESVKRLRDLFDTLGLTQSGKFLNYDGREYPW
jgi:hypothetical protein